MQKTILGKHATSERAERAKVAGSAAKKGQICMMPAGDVGTIIISARSFNTAGQYCPL
jgi:hypothetical protein